MMRVFGQCAQLRAAAISWAVLGVVQAIELHVNSTSSIRTAASIIAFDMISYYTGNITGTGLGLLPAPYYWWESGEMWNTMVNYWHYTNDSTYNFVTTQALLANVGPAYNFMVPTEYFDEGNDDEAYWGMGALSAAEFAFPAPPSPYPPWLELAEAMWNTEVYRWNTTTCNGGLKWQVFPYNAGYDYKNSVSNGAFFQMSARLLRSTGNATYMTWAERAWNWSTAIGLVDSRTYAVFDGTNDLINCSEIDHHQWSYTVGLYLLGAATMYNYTNGSFIWEQRTSGLIEAAGVFVSPYPNSTNIMYEAECETTSICNADQQSFKGSFARDMYRTIQMAPYAAGALSTILRASAIGAAASCNGSVTTPKGITNYACGSRWYTGTFDNVFGVGEQLTALEVIQGLLVNLSSTPGYASNVHLNTTAPARVTRTVLPTPSHTPIETARPRPTIVENRSHSLSNGWAVVSCLVAGVFHIFINLI